MRSVGRQEMACSDPNQPAADVKRHTVAESSNMMYISHSLLSTKMQRHPLCAFCWARAKELHFQTGDLLLERKQCYIYKKNKQASQRGNKVSPFFAAGGEISVPGERSRRRKTTGAAAMHSHQSTALIAGECDWFSAIAMHHTLFSADLGQTAATASEITILLIVIE